MKLLTKSIGSAWQVPGRRKTQAAKSTNDVTGKRKTMMSIARYQDSLAGKRVVVTGGASGIGLATALRFAAEQAKVMIFDISQEKIETVLTSHPQLSGGLTVDVSQAASVTEGYSWLDEKFGGIDVLIANAGISYRMPFTEISEKQWNEVLDVNLNGVFYCAQAAAKRMVQQGNGVILMTASTNGMVGHPNYADYNASKAAITLLARTMALELAPMVRVNSVCPGYVETPMQLAEYTPAMLAEVNQGIPLKRHAKPEEIASLYAFLASSEAAYITGQNIPIDGGELA